MSPFDSSSSGKTLELDFLTAFELAAKAPADGPTELAAYRELQRLYANATADLGELAPSFMLFLRWASIELGALELDAA